MDEWVHYTYDDGQEIWLQLSNIKRLTYLPIGTPHGEVWRVFADDDAIKTCSSKEECREFIRSLIRNY